MGNTRVVRISTDLDKLIREVALKNELKYTPASKELAKVGSKIKFSNTKIFRELKF